MSSKGSVSSHVADVSSSDWWTSVSESAGVAGTKSQRSLFNKHDVSPIGHTRIIKRNSPSTPVERTLTLEQLIGRFARAAVHEVVVDVVEPGGAREVDDLVRRRQSVSLAARSAVAARDASCE